MKIQRHQPQPPAPGEPRQAGFTLIEVLIAMMVLTVGLLGLVGMQLRMVDSEIESYQRSQALLLVRDMADRVSTNRSALSAYTSAAPKTSPVGAGMTCPTVTTTSTLSARDIRQWCLALQGAAETRGGSSVGGLTGGRGCIERLGTTSRYMVTVAWQGQLPLTPPPDSVACGKDLYDGSTGSQCTSDRCRRVVTMVVNIATL